jgi:Rrf2 family protein
MKTLAETPERRVNTREVAGKLRSSEAHLAKVFQSLARERLVSSTRGPRGGFRLGRPATEISLLDIVQALDGAGNPSSCAFQQAGCRGRPCVLGRQLIKQRKELTSFMAATTLASYSSGSVVGA